MPLPGTEASGCIPPSDDNHVDTRSSHTATTSQGRHPPYRNAKRVF